MASPRSTRLLRLAFVAGVALAAVWWLATLPVDSLPSFARPSGASAPGAAPAAAAAPDVAAAPSAAPSGEEPASSSLPGLDPDDLRGAWAEVDMEAARAALPDNLYWTEAVPTRDARVLDERAKRREAWNEQYGKVLSGTADLAEIEAYYDHRHRLSSDYVEFVDYVLEHHGDDLPERDARLLALARRLHLARLAEIPGKLEEARARKREQDAARRAWREQEAAFAGSPEK